MPRQSGVAIQNKFVRGLVTETTALSFPEDACTEADNVVFDSTGRVTRRLGFDIEAAGTFATGVTKVDGEVHTSYIWQAPSGQGNRVFYVVQEGADIDFFDASTSLELGDNLHLGGFSLDTYIAEGSDEDAAFFACQFASGNGDLFIVNPACEPIYVSYDHNADTFSVTEISIIERDFEGLEDGLDDTERPTATIAGIESSNPAHLYNLYNQGWYIGDALDQWDTSETTLPSNCDYVALYRDTEADAFDPTHLAANDPGNRLAPKGHFLIDAFQKNRQEALVDAGYSFEIVSGSSALIDPSTGTIFTDFDVRSTAAFDGDLAQDDDVDAARKNNATTAYMGKNYGASPKAIAKAIVYPCNTADIWLETGSTNYPVTITLYGNTALPASGTDGTSLGSTSVTSTDTAPETILSSDQTTEYQYVWLHFDHDGAGNDDFVISEVQFYSNSLSFQRPSCVEFYAGRVFYAGVDAEGLSSNIYFSQLIEKEDQYGRCYQKNDPTSEFIPDLLPDDGGVIKIPEIGTITRLFSYQNAMLVFASNGIWLVAGSAGSNFKADDYVVKKISSIGMRSPNSLCSIKGLPAWWGEDGIYTVQFDPNYDSFTPTSITAGILDDYYSEIPIGNKRYTKGIYDEEAQVAYWFYSNDVDLGDNPYAHDSVLCFDAKSRAFYPWTISSGPVVRGAEYLKPGDRTDMGKIKTFLHIDYNGSTTTQAFGEILNDNYLDWEDLGTSVAYESYFVTGYRLDGQTQRFFQPNYVFVFLEAEANASCFMQGVYDFTTSSVEGKWSTRQQIYNDALTNRSVNFRRLKVRGKGRSLQLRFESEEQKPFTIIGWSIFETSNSGL